MRGFYKFVNISIKKSVYQKLKEDASSNGKTRRAYIEKLIEIGLKEIKRLESEENINVFYKNIKNIDDCKKTSIKIEEDLYKQLFAESYRLAIKLHIYIEQALKLGIEKNRSDEYRNNYIKIKGNLYNKIKRNAEDRKIKLNVYAEKLLQYGLEAEEKITLDENNQ